MYSTSLLDYSHPILNNTCGMDSTLSTTNPLIAHSLYIVCGELFLRFTKGRCPFETQLLRLCTIIDFAEVNSSVWQCQKWIVLAGSQWARWIGQQVLHYRFDFIRYVLLCPKYRSLLVGRLNDHLRQWLLANITHTVYRNSPIYCNKLLALLWLLMDRQMIVYCGQNYHSRTLNRRRRTRIALESIFSSSSIAAPCVWYVEAHRHAN